MCVELVLNLTIKFKIFILPREFLHLHRIQDSLWINLTLFACSYNKFELIKHHKLLINFINFDHRRNMHISYDQSREVVIVFSLAREFDIG